VETLYFGDANNAAFLTAVLSGFGALFGFIVYKVASRRAAAVVGAAIFLAFAGFAYWLYLTPFYAVEVDADHVRLRSFYPSRAVTLGRDEIVRFARRNEVTKNNYVVTLVVHTRDGRSYESGQARLKELAANVARLEAWLESR
jgi:hypothetical protein